MNVQFFMENYVKPERRRAWLIETAATRLVEAKTPEVKAEAEEALASILRAPRLLRVRIKKGVSPFSGKLMWAWPKDTKDSKELNVIIGSRKGFGNWTDDVRTYEIGEVELLGESD